MKIPEKLKPRNFLNRFSFSFDPNNYFPKSYLNDGCEFLEEQPNFEENPFLETELGRY